jgi:hypothetical protein
MQITVFNKPAEKKRIQASESAPFQHQAYKPYRSYGHPDHPFPQKLAYKPYGHPSHPYPLGGIPPATSPDPTGKPDRNAAEFLEHNRWRLPAFAIQRAYSTVIVQVEKDDADDIEAALETAGFEFDAEEDN